VWKGELTRGSPAGYLPRVSREATPPAPVRFDDLPLSMEARAGLKTLGYELATPVQSSTFGPAMAGRDLMVQSKTGTGKTTAFGLPLIERIRLGEGLQDPQALILCPTRELAMQVAEELAELGDPKGVRVLPIYGGAPMGPQLASLRAGADVVVGTPGRVLDHIRRRTLRLVHVHLAVLDEADEMLSMGFWEEVTAILDQLPDDRQTLLFSATLPDQIRKTAQSYLHEPQQIDISRDELTVEGIENIYYETDDRLPKPRNLLYILEVERPENAIIFCNTRDDTSIVAAFMRRQGFHAYALSGDLAQRDRERIMGRMKRGELQYLVATDIAARGIDISDLSHVILYSLPEFTEVYVHRVGRTGRIGKKGTAISLVSGRDEMTLTQLKRQFGIQFQKRLLPDPAELVKLHAARVASDLFKEAREVEITSFLPLAETLRQIDGGTEAIAYLLKRYYSELEEARARQDEEADLRQKRESAERQARRQVEIEERSPAPTREDDDDDDGGKKRDKKKKKKKKREAERGRTGEETPPRETTSGEGVQDIVRLFVNRGSSDGYDEKRIRALIVEVGGKADGMDPNAVSRVLLRRTHAFVETRPEIAEAAIQAAMRGVEREDKPVAIELARTR
jgi:ATP-dependent RNA helicase DeaD